jgi:hypothetical protein
MPSFDNGDWVRAKEDIHFNGTLTILKGTTGQVRIPTEVIIRNVPVIDGLIGVHFEDSVNGMDSIMVEEWLLESLNA